MSLLYLFVLPRSFDLLDLNLHVEGFATNDLSD